MMGFAALGRLSDWKGMDGGLSRDGVLVEPLDENLEVLKQNLLINDISAQVIPAAAGRVDGEVTLFFRDQSQALPSLSTAQKNGPQVRSLLFDKIVTGGRYGLKIDIEGAEALSVEFPTIIENAWILGELHYSGDAYPDALIDAYFELVKRTFRVEKGRPIAYFVGDHVVCVRTSKRRNTKTRLPVRVLNQNLEQTAMVSSARCLSMGE